MMNANESVCHVKGVCTLRRRRQSDVAGGFKANRVFFEDWFKKMTTLCRGCLNEHVMANKMRVDKGYKAQYADSLQDERNPMALIIYLRSQAIWQMKGVYFRDSKLIDSVNVVAIFVGPILICVRFFLYELNDVACDFAIREEFHNELTRIQI